MGLFDLLGDVVRIATAPIEIAADIATAVTKPVAEVAQDIVDTIKREVK